MKKILLSTLLTSLTCICDAQWSNSDFEQTTPGSYSTATGVTGWTISSQTHTSCAPNNTWSPGSPEFSIVATPLANLPYIGTLTTSPLNGTNIAVIHDGNSGALRTKIARTYSVNAWCSFFEFAFAAVFEDGSHTCCEQAGFNVRIRDAQGNILSCPSYSLGGVNCQFVPSYSAAPGVRWTNWRYEEVHLNQFYGSSITIELIVNDCAYGDHSATVYLDARAGPCTAMTDCCMFPILNSAFSSSFCPGTSNAAISAPEGYQYYYWQGPPSNPVPVGQSTLSSITLTNAISGTYSVTLVNAPSCIQYSTITISQQSVSLFGLFTTPSCPLGTSGSATLHAQGSMTGYDYLWVNQSNQPVGTTSIVSNLGPGNYTAYVTAAGSQSSICGTATTAVLISTAVPTPAFRSQAYCTGQPAYLSSSPGSNHQWFIGATAVSATSGGTNSSFVLPSPNSSVVPAVGYDSPQGCRDSIRFYLFNVAPGTISLTSNPLTCAGTHTGSATLSFVPVISSPAGTSTIVVNSLTNTPAFTSSTSGVYTMALTGLAANGHYLVTAFDGSCYYFDTLSVKTQPRPQLSITPALPTQLCQGQFALASVSVTNMHFSAVNYSWSPTTWLLGQNGTFAQTFITPTAAPGASATIIYTIEVNPKAIPCPSSKTVAISISNPVTPTLFPVPPVCPTGSVQLSGAPPGGIFSGLSPALNANGLLDLSKLPAGTHTFSYTNSMGSCHAIAISQFTVNPAPAISVTGNTSICSGESATLTASGAQTYVWHGVNNSPQAVVSPVSTSSFVVTGTSSNGCATSKNLVVKVTPTPTLAVTGPTNICSGDLLFMTASGADQYFWSTKDSTAQIFLATVSTATYSVIGTNLPAFCTNTAVFTVSVLPLPQLMVSGPTSVCIGDQVTITATGAQSYQWNGLPGGPTYSMILQSTDTFTIKGTGQNGCSQVAHHAVVADPCAGLWEGANSRSVIYPNPVIDKLYITVPHDAQITLTDALGKLILEKELRAGSHKLALDSFAEGIYYLKMESAAGKSVIKIIKND